MSTVILRGDEAVHYADVHNLSLNCDADASHDARQGISLEEAQDIAEEHPELVWIEVHTAVNSGEDPMA